MAQSPEQLCSLIKSQPSAYMRCVQHAAHISRPGCSLVLGPGCQTIKFALSSVGTPPAEERSTRKLPTDPKRRAVREWLTTRSITTAEL